MIALKPKNFPKQDGLYMMQRISGGHDDKGDVFPSVVLFERDQIMSTGGPLIVDITNRRSVPKDTLFSDRLDIQRKDSK